MIRARTAAREFQGYLTRRGATLDSLTPAAAVDTMIAFYRDIRATDCQVDQDGDMLLLCFVASAQGTDGVRRRKASRTFLPSSVRTRVISRRVPSQS